MLQIYTMEELEVIADLCQKHDVLVISDEVYEWMVYSPNKHVRIGTTILVLSFLCVQNFCVSGLTHWQSPIVELTTVMISHNQTRVLGVIAVHYLN